ncbi:MAG: four helix bundle protein [Ardenticatenales bacterium]|nr:four helix bundle protein [Ardenticatenales bacterium]
MVEDLHDRAVQFPDKERFGLTHQLRRAAVPIPLNRAGGAIYPSA